MKLNKLYKALYSMKRSGIYCLVNNKHKIVYVTYSKDISMSLARNIRDLQDKTFRYRDLIKYRNNLNFEHLESLYYEDTRIDIAIKMNYYIEYYKSLGYNVCNTKNIVEFRVRLDVATTRDKLENIRIHVKLISKRYNEVIVGVFETMKEANEFSQVFNNMKFIRPVYAINSLTKEYIENNCR